MRREVKLLDAVALLEDVQAEGVLLQPGEVGAVVEVLAPDVYEYEYPARHWELDDQGQPTQQTIERRRRAEFITPIPKPRKRKGSTEQPQFIFDEGKGLSTQEQQYDHTAIINAVRQQVDQ
jgi:Domain of unknown function (DUF4926)